MMRSQKLFAALIFLFLGSLLITACGSTVGTGGSTPTSSYANALVRDTALSTLKIEANIPLMMVGHETDIRVSLFPTGGNISVADASTIPNATSITTAATPVGTPGNTLVNAFGKDRIISATATLQATSDIFSVASLLSQTKNLDLNVVEWDWFVTPKLEGQQFIGVDIEVTWQSTANGKSSEQYTLGYPQFPINVEAAPIFSLSPTPAPPSPTPTPQPRSSDSLALLNIVTTLFIGLLSICATIFAAFSTIPSFRRWMRLRMKKLRKRPLA
jgi:hypothetical protein